MYGPAIVTSSTSSEEKVYLNIYILKVAAMYLAVASSGSWPLATEIIGTVESIGIPFCAVLSHFASPFNINIPTIGNLEGRVFNCFLQPFNRQNGGLDRLRIQILSLQPLVGCSRHIRHPIPRNNDSARLPALSDADMVHDSHGCRRIL